MPRRTASKKISFSFIERSHDCWQRTAHAVRHGVFLPVGKAGRLLVQCDEIRAGKLTYLDTVAFIRSPDARSRH
jgi:hypothetical protein